MLGHSPLPRKMRLRSPEAGRREGQRMGLPPDVFKRLSQLNRRRLARRGDDRRPPRGAAGLRPRGGGRAPCRPWRTWCRATSGRRGAGGSTRSAATRRRCSRPFPRRRPRSRGAGRRPAGPIPPALLRRRGGRLARGTSRVAAAAPGGGPAADPVPGHRDLRAGRRTPVPDRPDADGGGWPSRGPVARPRLLRGGRHPAGLLGGCGRQPVPGHLQRQDVRRADDPGPHALPRGFSRPRRCPRTWTCCTRPGGDGNESCPTAACRRSSS